MANEPDLALREAVVERLRQTDALIEITTAENVFGEQPDVEPTRPFTRYGVDESIPYRPLCWEGVIIEFPIHSFSQKKFSNEVREMNGAVKSALNGTVFEFDDGTKAELVFTGSSVNRDAADPKGWHGITRFRATI